jgi:AcrR family transcriptional regulator
MPNERKTDPRIERSREALTAAFFALVGEKGFDAISVQDIADRARLNRATFYLHYKDKQDLLLRSGEAVFDALAAEAGSIDQGNLGLDEPPNQLLILFRHIAGHQAFYRIALGPSGAPAFMTRMRNYAADFTRKRMLGLHALHPSAAPLMDDAFISEYVTGALMGVIVWWLEEGLPHTPEYMADRFGWLSVAGVYRMMGLEPPGLEE